MFRLLVACIATLASAITASSQTNVTFLSTNDIDQFEAFGGLSGVVAAERATGENIFLLHAGDSLSPSVLSGIDKGAHIVELLNIVKPDFMTVGNHEFDFGPAVLEKAVADLDFTILAGNIAKDDGSQLPGTQPSALLEVDGFKIGILGLTTPETSFKSAPGDYKFAPNVETAETLAAELRSQGAELIVALVHLNLQEDLELVRSRVADIIVSGDDHHQMAYYNGHVALMESAEQADIVMALDIILERDGDEIDWTPSFRVIPSNGVKATDAMATQIAALKAQLDTSLNTVIGKTATPLDTTRPVVRAKESAFANLVVDAMRAATNADLGFTNGGTIRAQAIYEPGQLLSVGDIMRELPFGNKTVVLELTGQQLIDALENGVSAVEDGAGRFPHISGFAFVADLSRPVGSRIVDVTINDQAIDPTAIFTLATNEYIARGGDNYQSFAAAKTILEADDASLVVSQVIDYISAAGEVSPVVEGRMTFK